ncbi:MAG TPA: HNH endonuclease [Chthonomonadaceae bacterium]|nr:HNH endonuclease [Chthonomonadaceae bacterium]
MTYLYLTGGGLAQVDDDDAKWLSRHTWSLFPSGRTAYARTHVREADGKFHRRYMHTMILRRHGRLPDGLKVDHINGDGLDNRKENLRPATHAQNHQNRRKIEGCSSRYKGVSWNKERQRWRAYIYVNRKRIELGYYADEKEAALAYDRAALQYFGEFAKPNFSTLAVEAPEASDGLLLSSCSLLRQAA